MLKILWYFLYDIMILKSPLVHYPSQHIIAIFLRWCSWHQFCFSDKKISYRNIDIFQSFVRDANYVQTGMVNMWRRLLKLWGWLFVFYGISTLVGYLMTNPDYTYGLLLTFLNEPELICLLQTK